MDKEEWIAFRNAVRENEEGKENASVLSHKNIKRSVKGKWEREKLAKQGFRDYIEQHARKEQLARFGFVVKIRIDSIDGIWNNGPGTTWDPKHADNATFLQIRLEPDEEFFLPIGRTKNYRPDSGEYHISLCYTSDLHRFNLYDFTNGLAQGKAAYDRIRERYDGKVAHLRGTIRTGSLRIGNETRVVVERRARGKHEKRYDPVNNMRYHIYNDPDVLALLAAGQYIRDDLHMTL